jgi:serine/threonine-protein kinase
MAAIAAERDLLFGLLALQNGLIDQGQLVAAFQAWTRDRARSLADHLTARGDLDPDQRAGVEAMVGLHLKKHGDAQRSLAAIPAGRSTRESLAALGDPDIEHTLTQLASDTEDDADRTASYSVGTATSDGQRFRVLRPHARGGLGAVFVALDAELHREVALKRILDDRADDPVSRARFLLEAEITGGLEHPGIVPIYGLGASADGRPYYAMRFIKGDSLKEAVDRFHADAALRSDPGRRSLELRKLLRRFTDVCNAIEYAHSRGVLHRDIKPGNIIVGKHGETLVVDWGLAKATGRSDPSVGERTLVPSSASGSAETLPGSVLGTPAYMSPEQAEGDLEHLGPRSDVYSLGATLYYLLTGRPPAEGELHEVIRAVQRGEFRPPRQVEATIDPALEAVCLKAMATRPEDRYAGCRALAEDVERWMADEPVSAWREPLRRRARRWANRNRTAVTAAVVGLVAGLASLGAIATVQARANADLKDANAKIEARYNLAVDAIRTFHTGVSEDFLLKEDRFKELRDRLLKSASDFYGRLGALLEDDADRPSRRALLQANYELADLADQVGRKEDALALHRRVLAGREALAAAGADPALAVDLVRSRLAVGTVLEATGRTGDALAAYERAREAVATADSGPPRGAAARSAFADAEFRAGVALRAVGRTAEALRAAERARGLQADLAAADPWDRDRQAALARSHNFIGLLLRDTGKSAEARAALEAARAIQRGLAEAHPDVTRYQVELANSHAAIGSLLELAMARPAEALVEYEAARAIRQRLAQAHPAVTRFQSDLANSLRTIGWDLFLQRKLAEARGVYEAEKAIRQRLAEAHPGVTELQLQLARNHEAMGDVLGFMGRTAEQSASYRAALAIWQKLAAEHPDVTDFRKGLADSLTTLGSYREAVAVIKKLAEDHPDVLEFQETLAVYLQNAGNALDYLEGRPAEALAEYDAARAVHQKLAEAHPDELRFQINTAYIRQVIAGQLAQTGRVSEAEAELRQAQAILQALVGKHPAVSELRRRAAETRLELGELLWRAGDLRGAEAEWRAALPTYRELAREKPGDPEDRSRFAESLYNLGALLYQAGKPSDAEAEYRKALTAWQELADERPSFPIHRSRVASGLAGLSDLLRRVGRTAEAREIAQRAVALYEALFRQLQTDPMQRVGLARSLLSRAIVLRAVGESTGAAADARRALGLWDGLPSRTGEQWFEAACCRAVLSGLAGRAGAGVSAEEAASEADAAMSLLRRAVGQGYRGAQDFRTQDALDPLRGREDFRLLMMDLAMPAEPFAAVH